MFHTTKEAAQRWLNAGNFVPALKAQHRIVPTRRWHMGDRRWEPGYTVVLNVKGRLTGK